MSDYKPGTVADIDVPGRGWCRAFYVDGGIWLTAYAEADGIGDYETKNVTEVRPLVVLDPDDRKQVERLVRAFWDAQKPDDGDSSDFAYMAEALRSLTRPPKPAEPTGWLAAVVDAEGNRWGRPGGPTDGTNEWYSPDLNARRDWHDIDVVAVLSDGWEPKP